MTEKDRHSLRHPASGRFVPASAARGGHGPLAAARALLDAGFKPSPSLPTPIGWTTKFTHPVSGSTATVHQDAHGVTGALSNHVRFRHPSAGGAVVDGTQPVLTVVRLAHRYARMANPEPLKEAVPFGNRR